jgi:endonuclease/exonuclease/phosphatase family metal-dependent hydrolase
MEPAGGFIHWDSHRTAILEQPLMSREAYAPEATVALRVMTYNVHRCVGIDRLLSPERIAQVIASCHPDIVALQELDVRRARSGHIDQAEVIARDLGMDVHFFPAMRVMEELYGDAILSRWPARLVKAGPLPGFTGLRRMEPRGALWSAITIDGAEIQIINTHLGLLGAERMLQVRTLLGDEWLGHPDCRDPVILLGDFNATPRSRAYRHLTTHLRDAQRAPAVRRPSVTFPTRLPALRLDHVFVSHSVHVIAASTIRTPLARLASDHFPLVAEITVPAVANRHNRRDAASQTHLNPQAV